MEKAQLLKNAIKYAQENPSDPKSHELRVRLESGFYDKELKELTNSGALEIQPYDHKNILQKGLGAFLDPIIRTGVRAGEAVGDLTLTGINKLSGGALDKYTPEGNLSKALDRAENTTTKVPVLRTVIKPVKDITKKEVVGDALSTVGLGVGNVAGAGALLGAGNALQEDGGVKDVAIQTVVGAIGGKILEHGFQAVAPYIEKAGLQYGQPFLEKIAQYIPESGKQFMSQLATKVAGVAEKITPSTEGKIVPQAVTDVIEKGKNLVDQTINKPVDIAEKKVVGIASDAKNAVVDKVKTKFKTKTPDEILATPESDLYKLGKEERKYYFDHQKEKIAKIESDTQATIKAESEKTAEKLTNEATDLQRKLEVAGRDEVLDLRPKIRTALGKQSAEYRRLVDEEISAVEDFTVPKKELSTYVDKRFADNPEQAQTIKNLLGMDEKGSETTIQKIYKKTQDLGQEIKGAKKGTRVFTPQEKATDDAISTLVDFMKDARGVDLSTARNFWARYAPVRNQLVAEAKPFVQAPTQTKQFAQTLKRVASGKDVNNENFIKEVENLVGEKVGGKSKNIVAKLTANEKAQIASEIETQTKKAEAKLLKDLELKKLSEAEFEVERKASRRNIIKKILGGFGLVLVGGEARHIITGIGI